MRKGLIAALCLLAPGCADQAPTAPLGVLERDAGAKSGYVSPPGHYYNEQPFEIVFSCGTFDVRLSGTDMERNIGWFDEAGNLMRVEGLYRFEGAYTRIDNGESVPIKIVDHFTVDFSEEGVLQTDSGIWVRLKIPGETVQTVGRFIFTQEDGDVSFRVGQEEIPLFQLARVKACEGLS